MRMYSRSGWCLALVVLLVPVAAHSESGESVAAGGVRNFLVSGIAAAPGVMRQTLETSPRTSAVPGISDMVVQAQPPSQGGVNTGVPNRETTSVSGTPVLTADLAKLLNRHWKTSIAPILGGQPAYISGGFDLSLDPATNEYKNENFYLSVFTNGWQQPKFTNLASLQTNSGSVTVGNAKYVISLVADIRHPMRSKIDFENEANGNDLQEVSLQQWLGGVGSAGETLKLTDQVYQVFYANNVKENNGNPTLDTAAKIFIFLQTEGENIRIFFIPSELVEQVPQDKVAVFKMYNDKRIGMKIQGGILQIYENP